MQSCVAVSEACQVHDEGVEVLSLWYLGVTPHICASVHMHTPALPPPCGVHYLPPQSTFLLTTCQAFRKLVAGVCHFLLRQTPILNHGRSSPKLGHTCCLIWNTGQRLSLPFLCFSSEPHITLEGWPSHWGLPYLGLSLQSLSALVVRKAVQH